MIFRILLSTIIIGKSLMPAFSQPSKNTTSLHQRQDSATRVSWLKKNAVAIKTIDPSVEDFSDLQQLKQFIGDAQVVMIGEPNHHIGSVYAAKTRLVKFLHQEMGFDLLAFEAGMYDVAKAWQEIKSGKDARLAFRHSVFFGHYEEYKPLISYIQTKSGSLKPLEIAGFDSQLNGRYSRDSLLPDLRRFFGKMNFSSPALEDSSFFAKEFRKGNFFSGRWQAPDKKVIDTFNLLLKAIDSLAPQSTDPNIRFYYQALRSFKRETQRLQLNHLVPVLSGLDQQRVNLLDFTIRDEQMADNLLWYTKQFPQRRIIVWAHNVHVMNDYPGDPAKEMWNSKADAPPAPRINWENNYMGWVVKDSLKNKVYSIAVTGNTGELGLHHHLDSTRSFKMQMRRSTVPGVLENYLEAAGFNFAFLNLKAPPKGGEWLKDKIIIRHSADDGSNMFWHKAVDGLLFIKNFSRANIKD